MPTRATGTFEIDSWDEKPYDEREGTKLARVRVAKTFRGDVEGVSTTDLLLAYGAEEGSAAYVGFERVVGSIHGRAGSLVLHHTATSSPNGRPAASRGVGVVRGVGSSRGRSGSFVLRHTATSSPNGWSATWNVVPDTGTGGLLG